MTFPVSGIILAGGENKRFGGREKAFITIGGRPILDHLYALYVTLFEEVIIVTNNPAAYLNWDCRIVTDIYDVRSSLTGIHTGLFYATRPHAFFTACDTPFLQKAVVCAVLAAVTPHVDAVVPRTASGFEPLLAVYAKRCLKPVEAQLARRRFKIDLLFERLRLKTLEEEQLRGCDPDLVSLFNINTPDDLARAQAIEGGLAKERP